MSFSFTNALSRGLYFHLPIIDMNLNKFFQFSFHKCFIIMGSHCSLKALWTMTWLTMIIKLLSHFLGLVSQHTKWALVGLVEPQGPFNRLPFLFHQVCPVFHALLIRHCCPGLKTLKIFCFSTLCPDSWASVDLFLVVSWRKCNIKIKLRFFTFL